MLPAYFEPLLIFLTVIVMLIGVAGILLPLLPDLWLIWLAALSYGLLSGFDGWLGITVMLILTILAGIGMVADWLLSNAGAAGGGAAWSSILVSIGLGLIGLFFFPPLGPLIGAMLGLLGMEYFRHGRDLRRAGRAVGGYATGCGLSVIARLTIAGAMIALWGLWVYWGQP